MVIGSSGFLPGIWGWDTRYWIVGLLAGTESQGPGTLPGVQARGWEPCAVLFLLLPWGLSVQGGVRCIPGLRDRRTQAAQRSLRTLGGAGSIPHCGAEPS